MEPRQISNVWDWKMKIGIPANGSFESAVIHFARKSYYMGFWNLKMVYDTLTGMAVFFSDLELWSRYCR